MDTKAVAANTHVGKVIHLVFPNKRKKRSTYFGNVNKHEQIFLLGLSKMFRWDSFKVQSCSEHELVSFGLLVALSLFLILSICDGTFL